MKQRTDEWREARKGRITASRMSVVLMDPATLTHRDYVHKLVFDMEGVDDHLDDRENAPWFREGEYFEGRARGAYAWKHGVDVVEVGFIVHPKLECIGCSPDGLVGEDGGVELKYRKSLRTFDKAVKSGLNGAREHAQVQGCLWVTDRQWWDYVNFWCDEDSDVERLHVLRVERDDEYIKRLAAACGKFWHEVVSLYQERNGAGPPAFQVL